jgi:hypothetical protein
VKGALILIGVGGATAVEAEKEISVLWRANTLEFLLSTPELL